MFSKQEAAQLGKEFWTVFGQYMKPIPSFEGEKINWLNYKTGEKDVLFKLDADNKTATVSIDIVHADVDIQQLYFEQFLQLKKIFEGIAGEGWTWLLHAGDENRRTISRISCRLDGVSVYNKNDWPALISFFKPKIIALDEFWSNVRFAFEALH